MSTLTKLRPFEDIVDLFFNERSYKKVLHLKVSFQQ